MTEKELIQKTDKKLRLYELMKINFNNINDDILKLESKKVSPASSMIKISSSKTNAYIDDFNIPMIEEKIQIKRRLLEQLEEQMEQIERAIQAVRNDRYSFIIDEHYTGNKTMQEIADSHFMSKTTIFLNRNKLLIRIGKILFVDYFILNDVIMAE